MLLFSKVALHFSALTFDCDVRGVLYHHIPNFMHSGGVVHVNNGKIEETAATWYIDSVDTVLCGCNEK